MAEDTDNKTTVLLCTTDETAQLFGKKPLTVFRWRQKKNMPYVSIPAKQRSAIGFDLDAVLEWAEERHVPVNKKYLSLLRKRFKSYTEEN